MGWNFPTRCPSAYYLRGRGTGDRQDGSRRLSRLPEIVSGEDDPRKIRLHVPDPPDLLISFSVRHFANGMDRDPAFAASGDGCNAGSDAAWYWRGLAFGAA